jgi:hypothetical protein
MEQGTSWEGNGTISYSRKSPCVIEPEFPFPCSQGPAIGAFLSYMTQSTPNLSSLSSILIFSYLLLHFANGLQAFQLKCYTPFAPLPCVLLVRLSHPPWCNDPNSIPWGYKLWYPWLCVFLQLPVSSSVIGTNVFLSTLFSNNLNL